MRIKVVPGSREILSLVPGRNLLRKLLLGVRSTIPTTPLPGIDPRNWTATKDVILLATIALDALLTVSPDNIIENTIIERLAGVGIVGTNAVTITVAPENHPVVTDEILEGVVKLAADEAVNDVVHAVLLSTNQLREQLSVERKISSCRTIYTVPKSL